MKTAISIAQAKEARNNAELALRKAVLEVMKTYTEETGAHITDVAVTILGYKNTKTMPNRSTANDYTLMHDLTISTTIGETL